MRSLALFLALGAAAFAPKAPQEEAPDFDRVVAPLLAHRCLDCHSGAKPKGKLDLSRKAGATRVVAPGDPAKSLLWEQLDQDEMPPKKPLPAAEKKILKAWIAGGAKWGSDPIDPFRFTTDARAGLDWWSLKPLAPPAATPSIDAFLRERLLEAGLVPSPEADRRSLLRRLSFDLLGLPPTPDEVRGFLDDRSPDAYEKLVDRLLASPHYGERWARHWLDVVRFGESNGFERDLPRDNAWPYRNWVIDALNRDLPYDEFVRLQLAGDVLRPGDPDALTATGFLVAGPHDTVIPASDRMRMTMRQDELEDLVGTVGQTFLGLTVNCARCHDHKFDPVSAADYYRLAAALAGAQHGEREVRDPTAQTRLEAVTRELQEIERPARAALAGLAPPEPPKAYARWNFAENLQDREGKLHGSAQQGYIESAPLDRELKEKTLEAWVKLENLDQKGGGAIGVQTLDGSLFDAIVFGEREARRWMAGSNFFARSQSFGGPAETDATARAVHVAIVYQADGTITGYREGRPYGAPYKGAALQPFRAGEARVVFGVRHTPPGGNKMLAGTVVRATLYDRALSAAEVAASAGIAEPAEAEIAARLDDETRGRREAALRLRKELESTGRRKVYAVVPADPGVMKVLRRGDVSDPGDVVAPAGLSALPAPDLGLQPNATDSERRARLARWITSTQNPLFTRVIVNRLWHHHFGRGLVDTPNDFGFNGGRPSHPKLLDWLAGEIVRRGWRLKEMHKLIVSSAAYRQSSAARREGLEKDASNRFLWRRSPQRLEAEAIRDAMLLVCGDLDPTVGGKGYRDVRSHFFKGTQFYDPIEPEGPDARRRTLYRFGARGGRSPFLETFDCPDPSTTTPQRAVTTTPLQALALLNNAFVLRMADRLAERAARERGGDPAGRAILLAFGREATEKEQQRAAGFIREHGLAAFCRVILNTSEFLYVD